MTKVIIIGNGSFMDIPPDMMKLVTVVGENLGMREEVPIYPFVNECIKFPETRKQRRIKKRKETKLKLRKK